MDTASVDLHQHRGLGLHRCLQELHQVLRAEHLQQLFGLTARPQTRGEAVWMGEARTRGRGEAKVVGCFGVFGGLSASGVGLRQCESM